MQINDILTRLSPAKPWQHGEKIPWNDAEFSRRMLANHLTDSHDWASRRDKHIAAHVNCIQELLPKDGSKILDLGCGPGLYLQRLAQLGHHCTGVDFSPASIEYATNEAKRQGLDIEYVLSDIRAYESAQLFDCILVSFGEINVFSRQDALAILSFASHHLQRHGFLLIEVHTFDAVWMIGRNPASWHSFSSGIFSEKPHLCLQENFWDEESATATNRYYVIDAATSGVSCYGSSTKAYTDSQYTELFMQAGLLASKTLSPKEWPAGENFEGKLKTLLCHRKRPRST